MLAQAYYETQSQAGGDALASALLAGVVVVAVVFYTACLWRIFTKAGQPGWHALVPILNTYTLIKVVGRPGWWLLLTFLPCVGTLVFVVIYLDLAREFGKGLGFGLGLVFLSPLFLPILAFGRAEHGVPPNRDGSLRPAIPPVGFGTASGPPVAGFAATSFPRASPGAGTHGVGWSDPAPAALPPLSAVTASGAPGARPPPYRAEPPPLVPAPGAAPVAGWYTDPTDADLVRWWDGASWTADSQDRPGVDRDR